MEPPLNCPNVAEAAEAVLASIQVCCLLGGTLRNRKLWSKMTP